MLWRLKLFTAIFSSWSYAMNTSLESACLTLPFSIYTGSSCITLSNADVWYDAYVCPEIAGVLGHKAIPNTHGLKTQMAQLLTSAGRTCAYVALRRSGILNNMWNYKWILSEVSLANVPLPGWKALDYIDWAPNHPKLNLDSCNLLCSNEQFTTHQCDYILFFPIKKRRVFCQYNEPHFAKFKHSGENLMATQKNRMNQYNKTNEAVCINNCRKNPVCRGFSFGQENGHCVLHLVHIGHSLFDASQQQTGYSYWEKM